jgi:hypothetical protein
MDRIEGAIRVVLAFHAALNRIEPAGSGSSHGVDSDAMRRAAFGPGVGEMTPTCMGMTIHD